MCKFGVGRDRSPGGTLPQSGVLLTSPDARFCMQKSRPGFTVQCMTLQLMKNLREAGGYSNLLLKGRPLYTTVEKSTAHKF